MSQLMFPSRPSAFMAKLHLFTDNLLVPLHFFLNNFRTCFLFAPFSVAAKMSQATATIGRSGASHVRRSKAWGGSFDFPETLPSSSIIRDSGGLAQHLFVVSPTNLQAHALRPWYYTVSREQRRVLQSRDWAGGCWRWPFGGPPGRKRYRESLWAPGNDLRRAHRSSWPLIEVCGPL